MTRRMTASVIAMSMVMAIMPSVAFAEDIKGRVTDKATNEPLPFKALKGGSITLRPEEAQASKTDISFLILEMFAFRDL